MALVKDSRLNPRKALKTDLSPYLKSYKEREPILCMGIDVSRNGIGIVSFKALEIGMDVLITFKTIGIKLKVIWCNKDAYKDNIFHIGLQTQDMSHNLLKLFEQEGLLVSDEKDN